MKICDNFDHEDISYNSKECPLCEALETIKQLEKELDKASEMSGEQN